MYFEVPDVISSPKAKFHHFQDSAPWVIGPSEANAHGDFIPSWAILERAGGVRATDPGG